MNDISKSTHFFVLHWLLTSTLEALQPPSWMLELHPKILVVELVGNSVPNLSNCGPTIQFASYKYGESRWS